MVVLCKHHLCLFNDAVLTTKYVASIQLVPAQNLPLGCEGTRSSSLPVAGLRIEDRPLDRCSVTKEVTGKEYSHMIPPALRYQN